MVNIIPSVRKQKQSFSHRLINAIPEITKVFSVSADILFDLVNPEVRKEEIYAEYAEAVNGMQQNERARKLLEKAVREFPEEYKFYIILGTTIYHCVKDATIDNTDIMLAISYYDKVINECDDQELIGYAKIGKCIIYENLDMKDKVITTMDAMSFMKQFPGYMRLVDPSWQENE